MPFGRVCVTGGAGFIGSHVAEALFAAGNEVVVVDDFRTGRKEFLTGLLGRPGFTLVEGDVLVEDVLNRAIAGCDWVFHLQANADVRRGLDHPTKDLEQNTISTSLVLEAMRRSGVSRIVFSSTGSVYGEPLVFPTPEDAPFPLQTSLYGASKLASEGLLSAYAAGFGFTAIICRFVSILGERYTHGHVFDFYCALKRDPTRLTILGDGKQEKSYLYVGDCVGALLLAAGSHSSGPGVHVYNLGRDDTIIVDDSVRVILNYLKVSPEIHHTGGVRGWIGDSPLIHLDTRRIQALGWVPSVTIPDAIRRTLAWFESNDYVWRDQAIS